MTEFDPIYAAALIQADLERVKQARFAALDEMRSEYAKVVGPKSFRKWQKRVNRKYRAILARLN